MLIKWHIHLQHQKSLCNFLESWEKLKSPDSEQIAALSMCIYSIIAEDADHHMSAMNWAWAVVSTVNATTKILYNRDNKSWVGNLHVCTVLHCCKNAKINFSDFFGDMRLSQNQWYSICLLFNPPLAPPLSPLKLGLCLNPQNKWTSLEGCVMVRHVRGGFEVLTLIHKKELHEA